MVGSMVMQGLNALIYTFEDPLFLAFTLMIAFNVALGVKKLIIE